MVDYDKESALPLKGGFGAASVIKITEKTTGTNFVLKQGTPAQNVNAVLVSEFLKKVIDNQTITVQGTSLQFYTPTVTIDTDLDGNIVQKQEYLDQLDANIGGKKIQGLASIDSLREAAKLGAVYQFLMLGDNISHNNRITPNSKFNIFDFDSAIKLGGSCVTSADGIFADKVTAVNHAFNNHFIDILALRFKKDKYGYINFNKAAIKELEKEQWSDFLLGTKEGLELIKANISEDFILHHWGREIPPDNEAYVQEARKIIQQRLAGIDKDIAYLNDVLNGKRTILGITLREPIKDTLAKQTNVTTFLDNLNTTIAKEILKPAPKVVSNSTKHENQEKIDINSLLDSYLKGRTAVTNSSNKTKEYFHGRLFPVFQKSFTQKSNAIDALKEALNGNNVDLSVHLSTLRNGHLGKKLRAFVKSGMANDLVRKEVTTVSGFVQALQEQVSKQAQPS